MRKKWLIFLFGLTICFSFVLPVYGAEKRNGGISVLLDGKLIVFSRESGFPFVDNNGKTQVPLRAVMEACGCKVHWDGTTNTAILEKNDVTIAIGVGKQEMSVNGTAVVLDSPAMTVDDKIYLPIRPVLEAFGVKVTWNDDALTLQSSDTNVNDTPISSIEGNEGSVKDSYFKDIYVDKKGDLIFELAGGQVINAGNVTGGGWQSWQQR